jgi:hypothetical protein
MPPVPIYAGSMGSGRENSLPNRTSTWSPDDVAPSAGAVPAGGADGSPPGRRSFSGPCRTGQQSTVRLRSTKVTGPSRRGTRTAATGVVMARVTAQPAPGEVSSTAA